LCATERKRARRPITLSHRNSSDPDLVSVIDSHAFQEISVPTAETAAMVNRLIGSLPSNERSRLVEKCVPVELAFGSVVCESDQPLRHVYFPLTGFISLVMPVPGHPPLEMGLIGNEGMLGATTALGIDVAPMRCVVQGSGSALRTGAVQFRRSLRNLPGTYRLLHRYLYVLLAQLSRMAACTRFHDVEQRLARWLLMTDDRTSADHVYLTHAFLADMLGVQRSAVSIAAGSLQDRELIRYSRGRIRILSRAGLEAVSCGCYSAMIDEYECRLG
jgi:CRP-like cAMP-binding protein